MSDINYVFKTPEGREVCDMAWKDMMRFLESREIDIALGIEDFGELQEFFADVMGRDAQSAAEEQSK